MQITKVIPSGYSRLWFNHKNLQIYCCQWVNKQQCQAQKIEVVTWKAYVSWWILVAVVHALNLWVSSWICRNHLILNVSRRKFKFCQIRYLDNCHVQLSWKWTEKCWNHITIHQDVFCLDLQVIFAYQYSSIRSLSKRIFEYTIAMSQRTPLSCWPIKL
jgi:hypothetical protein